MNQNRIEAASEKQLCKVDDEGERKENTDCNNKGNEVADFSSLLQAIVRINREIGIPQSLYVTEECSELIKAFTKKIRKKGTDTEIIEEACDVLATIFVLLTELKVSKIQVRNNIVSKYQRQLDRFLDHGEV